MLKSSVNEEKIAGIHCRNNMPLSKTFKQVSVFPTDDLETTQKEMCVPF